MIYVSMSSEIFVECPLVVDLQKLKRSEKKTQEVKKNSRYFGKKLKENPKNSVTGNSTCCYMPENRRKKKA